MFLISDTSRKILIFILHKADKMDFDSNMTSVVILNDIVWMKLRAFRTKQDADMFVAAMRNPEEARYFLFSRMPHVPRKFKVKGKDLNEVFLAIRGDCSQVDDCVGVYATDSEAEAVVRECGDSSMTHRTCRVQIERSQSTAQWMIDLANQELFELNLNHR